jgi:hypothetical protein
MQCELKPSNDTQAATAAAQSPEQVWMLVRARTNESAVAKND